MASEQIVSILGNDYNPEILGATGEPCSAKDLSDQLEIPISTCYRRIEELTEMDLLDHHDRILSDEHRRISVYRRKVDRIEIEFTDGSYSVTIERRSEIQNKLDTVWQTLSEG